MKKKKVSIPRTGILFIIMFFASSILVLRLVYLQVVNGDMYKERADTSSVRTFSDPAPRGKILDRNGVVLADNKISYSIVYNQTEEIKLYFYPTIDKVMDILNENGEKLQDDFKLKYDEASDTYSFLFSTDDTNARKQQELRFKKDNGMEEKAEKDLAKEVKDGLREDFKNYSKEDKEALIDSKLLGYSARETYEYIRDDLLKISYENFFLKLCDIYRIDKSKSIEYFQRYFNFDASGEYFERIMDSFKGSDYTYTNKDDIGALIETLGLKEKKFDKQKERAYVIIASAMRLQIFSGYAPITLSNDIKEVTATIVNQKLSDMPGVDITTEPIRDYPFGTLASNVIGHLRSISPEAEEEYKLKGYDVSKDYVGADGIESAFEEELKGSTGGRIVKLNENGRPVSQLGSMSSTPGENVQLTIDKDVQYVGEKALEGVLNRLRTQKLFNDANTGNATRGAVVAIHVKTGEIIASVSLPGFDPNDLAAPGKLTIERSNYYYGDHSEEFYKDFVKKMGITISYDELFPVEEGSDRREDLHDLMPKPFFNYATMTRTSPGSTFKPVTALAGLSEGIITTQQTIYDGLRYSRYPGTENQFKDWNSYSFGNVNVTRAIEVSNNYFFFQVGDFLQEQKGPDKLAEYAWMFGLGADPDPSKKSSYSTGVEVYENFGQTYNEYSYRNSYMEGTFIPSICNQLLVDNEIDLSVRDEDTIEIKNIKNELIKEVKSQILNNEVEISEGKIYELLKELTTLTNNENLAYGYSNLRTLMSEKIDESKYPGNSLNAAIGQGMSEYTPLQLAVYMATLANQGERKSAHYVKNILDYDDNVVKSFTGETLSNLNINPEHYAAILEGLKRVNYGADGTVGEGVFDDFPIAIAGKTGSATYSEGIEELVGRTSYAVYAGFAPADDPEIAFAVVAFDGGHGGAVAPVVLRILEAYFVDDLKAMGYTPKHDLTGYDNIDMDSFIDEIYGE